MRVCFPPVASTDHRGDEGGAPFSPTVSRDVDSRVEVNVSVPPSVSEPMGRGVSSLHRLPASYVSSGAGLPGDTSSTEPLRAVALRSALHPANSTPPGFEPVARGSTVIHGLAVPDRHSGTTLPAVSDCLDATLSGGVHDATASPRARSPLAPSVYPSKRRRLSDNGSNTVPAPITAPMVSHPVSAAAPSPRHSSGVILSLSSTSCSPTLPPTPLPSHRHLPLKSMDVLPSSHPYEATAYATSRLPVTSRSRPSTSTPSAPPSHSHASPSAGTFQGRASLGNSRTCGFAPITNYFYPPSHAPSAAPPTSPSSSPLQHPLPMAHPTTGPSAFRTTDSRYPGDLILPALPNSVHLLTPSYHLAKRPILSPHYNH